MTDQQIPWRELVAILHRRRRFIAQIFLAGFVTVAIGVSTQKPVYRAFATLMVTSDRAQVVVSPDAGTRPTVENVTEQDMNSEVALIYSESLVRDVLAPYWSEDEEDSPSIFSRIRSVVTFPLRIPSLLYQLIHKVPPHTGLDSWAQDTLDKVGVGIVGRSNLIEVSFTSSNPKWAAEFVNKLVAKHIERRGKLSQQSEARRFFESQREMLAKEVCFRNAGQLVEPFAGKVPRFADAAAAQRRFVEVDEPTGVFGNQVGMCVTNHGEKCPFDVLL